MLHTLNEVIEASSVTIPALATMLKCDEADLIKKIEQPKLFESNEMIMLTNILGISNPINIFFNHDVDKSATM